MDGISEMYSMVSGIQNNGVEGYYVQKKYIDSKKMRQDRINMENKSKSVSVRPTNVSKKSSIFDEVQKKAAMLPSPCSYDPKQYIPKSKTTEAIVFPDRKTIFDEMQIKQKKQNYPGAGSYIKVQVQPDKKKLKANLSVAQNSTYLEACMRNSLDCPGVGNYNAYRSSLDKRGVKIVLPDIKTKRKNSGHQPPVGTYDPNPVSFDLFSNKQKLFKKKGRSQFSKCSRFPQNKEKKIPFYNILSQWGMKDNLKKKDIMSKISNHGSQSIYY